MKGLMGISGKKMTSIVFLLAVLFISLTLGSITFLVNNNDSTLPNVGLEGNKNMKDDEVSEEHNEEEDKEKKE